MITQNIFRVIVGGSIFVGLTFLISSYVVEQREKSIVDGITIQILEQQKNLITLAETTDDDEVDIAVSGIVRDCSAQNRNRFDYLLNNLATLSATEYSESKQLFDGCARFFSAQKSLMVARFTREYEVFAEFVNLLAIVDDAISISEFRVNDWQRLVELETRRSEIYIEQADVQLEIIVALQAGESVASEVITELTNKAKNIKEEDIVLNQQIDTLRTSLQEV